MPFYHRLGEIPPKRHSIFRRDNGKLYTEELMGNKGFVGPSSLLYHIYQPTQIYRVETVKTLNWEADSAPTNSLRHFRLTQLAKGGSPTMDRIPVLFNSDVALLYVEPDREDPFFYRNAQGDEVVYVSEGDGVLETLFGELPYRQGDYLVIPRGILFRFRFGEEKQSFLVVESAGEVRTPSRYRNEVGQHTEMSPYSERDFRVPEKLVAHDESGEFPVRIKKEGVIVEAVMDHHPLDVQGWDGYYYPWAFNIHDFEPRVGRFHLPPPVHQTFQGDGFVICSFCPRPYDFDEAAIPIPYNHSNVMSDEVIFYASAEFMSRKGIEYGSLTVHPDGFAHGPHPGKAEESLREQRTDELAVMLDTFRPLHVSRQVLEVEDSTYLQSWIEGGGR